MDFDEEGGTSSSTSCRNFQNKIKYYNKNFDYQPSSTFSLFFFQIHNLILNFYYWNHPMRTREMILTKLEAISHTHQIISKWEGCPVAWNNTCRKRRVWDLKNNETISDVNLSNRVVVPHYPDLADAFTCWDFQNYSWKIRKGDILKLFLLSL